LNEEFTAFLVGIFLSACLFGFCGAPAAHKFGQRETLKVTAPCPDDAGTATVKVRDYTWVCIDGARRTVD
jgi:hypothetical protein